ncbi:DNA-binding protein [Nocardioides sp. CF8]|nr:DNA-binding protein [Nocardioides sp. CF8]
MSKAKVAVPLRCAVRNAPVRVQRPSSRRQASHSTTAGSMLKVWRWALTASPSVRAPVSPALRRSEEAWARCATWARSASTGAAKTMILSIVVWAACATDSAVSPPRMRVWMSRGRRALSI